MANHSNQWTRIGFLLLASYPFWTAAAFGPIAMAQEAMKTVTLSGVVGDTSCGNAHTNGTARQCTIQCVKNGSSYYALIIGQRSYMLQGKVSELEKVAGMKAKVTGYMRSDSMMVTAATPE